MLSETPNSFKNVWLCDDDPDDHYVFNEAMSQAMPEAKLSLFKEGRELIDNLNKEQPDILFLDINMPGINGVETLELIRESAGFQEIPIIMYSVSQQRSDIETCYENGAVLYLVKPQLYQDLVKQLRAISKLDWRNKESITSLHLDNL